jgi:hypothetical protein
VNVVDIGNVAHDVDGFQRSKIQVVVPGQIPRLGNCAAPRNQEDLVSRGFALANKGLAGLPRPSQHPAHGAIHRVVAGQVQGLLALIRLSHRMPRIRKW